MRLKGTSQGLSSRNAHKYFRVINPETGKPYRRDARIGTVRLNAGNSIPLVPSTRYHRIYINAVVVNCQAI